MGISYGSEISALERNIARLKIENAQIDADIQRALRRKKRRREKRQQKSVHKNMEQEVSFEEERVLNKIGCTRS